MNNKQHPWEKYPWLTVRFAQLCAITGCSPDYVKHTIRGLPENIYWSRYPGSTRVLYNLNLIRDWLVNGDSPAHQKAVEKYIASLPSSDAA
jgi:hypothetical protein